MSTHRRGFTIIELVVTLGLVLLLAGLTASVGVAVVEKSERSRTENVLRLLDAATSEWELAADRKLRWWQYFDPGRDVADVHADTQDVLIITEILDIVTRPATVRSTVAQIDPELVYRYTAGQYPSWIDSPQERSEVARRFGGSITVLDAWGTPIYATHPGRTWTEADRLGNYPLQLQRDADGTISTLNEAMYGIAPNRRVVYVSAGPDGYFGFDGEFLHLGPGERPDVVREARKDNVYSTPVTYHTY